MRWRRVSASRASTGSKKTTASAPISPAFVKALQEILSGLERVLLTENRLHAALVEGGLPCTVAELKERFDGFVAGITKGKDLSRVRVVIEKNSSGIGSEPGPVAAVGRCDRGGDSSR